MARVFIGNSSGSFLFRASLPGHDALSAADQYLTIKEGMAPLTPKEVSTATLGGNASVTVGLSRSYSVTPFIVLKATDNTLPGADTFYARLTAGSNVLKLYNRLARTLTIKAFIFDEVIF